jgi:hypothetical protein
MFLAYDLEFEQVHCQWNCYVNSIDFILLYKLVNNNILKAESYQHIFLLNQAQINITIFFKLVVLLMEGNKTSLVTHMPILLKVLII